MATWNQILDPWVYILLRKAVLRKIFVLLHGCCGLKFYTLHRWQRSMLHSSVETSSSSGGSSDCRCLGKTPVHNVVIKSITWTLSWVFYLRTPRCWKTKGKKIIWNTRRTFLKNAYPKINLKWPRSKTKFPWFFLCMRSSSLQSFIPFQLGSLLQMNKTHWDTRRLSKLHLHKPQMFSCNICKMITINCHYYCILWYWLFVLNF